MIRILSEIAVTLSASPAISLLAKGTLVATAGLISAWFARKSRAAVRHALLASTFSVLLALPIVSLLAAPVPITVSVSKGDSNISPLFDYISLPSPGTPNAVRGGAATAKSGWPPYSLSAIALPILFWGWCLGTALFVLQIMGGFLQIRSLRRFGLPWRQGQLLTKALTPDTKRGVEVVLHESLSGPVTCGVLKPLIILPADAQSWEEQDLERALIHEMEHIRRNDWAIHCLARFACAIYWFHPLVWTAWRQLTLAAERSCDDAVLRNSEATAYADQLVGLARKRSILRKSPALAMASRSDLAARVSALLDGSQRRGPVGTVLVAVACIAAAAIAFTMSPLQIVAAQQGVSAQDNTTRPLMPMARGADPAFEVAAIKPSDPNDRSQGFLLKDRRISIEGITMTGLICFAYSIQRNQIVKAPQWFDEQPWNIEGVPDTEGAPNWHQYRQMLQKLLSTRFGLVIHHDKRELSVYTITIAKAGPKLEKSKSDADVLSDQSVHSDGAARYMKFTNYSMTDFAQAMQLMVDRPVVDQTNLSGRYDFTLRWTPDTIHETPKDDAPDLFSAVQEQLGLKLVVTRTPTDVLVIDAASRPTEN